MSPTLSKTKQQLSRYRVTLDVLVDGTICDPPSKWNWKDMIGLGDTESINDVYVENLGEV